MASPSRGKPSQNPTRRAAGKGQNAPSAEVNSAWMAAVRKLEAHLKSGRFEEGARLPTEAAMSRELGINRHALRRAIDGLVAKGVVRRIAHVGSFVAPQRLPLEISGNSSVVEGLERLGIKRGHLLVSQRSCMPPQSVARLLGVAQRTQVIEVVHVSTANKAPFSHVTTWLPADRFTRAGALIAAAGNAREALAQLGISTLRRRAVRILSRQASAAEVRMLELPTVANVLVIDSLGVDQTGEPTHVTQCVVDAGRVELILKL